MKHKRERVLKEWWRDVNDQWDFWIAVICTAVVLVVMIGLVIAGD